MLSPSLPAKPADSCWAVPVSAIERTLIAISPFVDRPGPAVLERRDRGRLLRRLEAVRLELQAAVPGGGLLAPEEGARWGVAGWTVTCWSEPELTMPSPSVPG